MKEHFQLLVDMEFRDLRCSGSALAVGDDACGPALDLHCRGLDADLVCLAQLRYHATESDWTGALDITMVIHLCMSCLWQLAGFDDLTALGMAWLVTLALLCDDCRTEPFAS